MSISERIVEQLAELSDQGSPQPGRVITIPIEEDGLRLDLAVQDYDRYSVTFRYLEVTWNWLDTNKPDMDNYLRQAAERVTRRLTYLEEPVELVELDEDEGTAQLRSMPPRRQGDKIIYWEVMVLSGPQPGTRLSRYQWDSGTGQREPLVYAATFATVGRLVEDLAISLREELAGS